MAIIDSAEPVKMTPAYNPVVYMADSDNKNKKGFRYIFEVFGVSNEHIVTQKVTPNLDGLGVIDVSRIVSNYVSYNHNNFNANLIGSTQSDTFKNIYTFVGEEYYEEVDYSDFNYLSKNTYNPPLNPQNLNNFTTLVTSTLPPYIAGDMIFVTQNSNTPTNPQINGIHQVLDVIINPNNPAQYVIILNLSWLGASPGAEGGKIVYSDNRKTKVLKLHTYSPIMVINTSLTINEFSRWTLDNKYDDYIMTDTVASTTKKFLSIIDKKYTIKENNRVNINYASFGIIEPPRYLRITTSDGTIADRTISGQNTNRILTIQVGTINTNWGTIIQGTAPVIKPTTEWYDIQLMRNDKIKTNSEKIRFHIDRKCSIDNIELMWLDKYGSFLNFNFTLINDEILNINRDTFTKQNGEFDSVNWGMFISDEFDRGKTIYNSDYTVKYKLRTEPLTKEKEALFHQLIKSPEVYIIENDGEIRSVVINTNSITIPSKRRGVKIFELDIELANKVKINI